MARQDGQRRLAEGTVVEAQIRARLLGMPVLRVEARIFLAPAEISLDGTPARRSPSGRQQQSPLTGDLAQAVRMVEEATATTGAARSLSRP